MPDYQ